MTAFAIHALVRAGERKGALVMVEGGFVPIVGRVAGTAFRAEAAVVLVILRVAGVTIGGCTFINSILVTTLASHFRVFAFEFERGEVVVELGGFPALGVMARAAIGAELTGMRVILLVAGGAFGRRGTEIVQRTSRGVTIRAFQLSMLPLQSERERVVRERRAESVDPIVAGQTVRAIFEQVHLRKPKVDLFVTGLADGWIESGNAIGMTIVAHERLTRDRELVTV
jgi:hypothetical protein